MTDKALQKLLNLYNLQQEHGNFSTFSEKLTI